MLTVKNLLTTTALVALVSVTVSAGTAKLQVIHNAADPAAETVDIYVNGDLFLDAFGFREATPFVEVPSDVDLTIGVAPGNSGSSADVIAEFPVRFADGERYVAIANGILDPGAFASNPDGRSIGFSIFPKDGIRTTVPNGWLVGFTAFHGATDAPAVDVLAQRLGSGKPDGVGRKDRRAGDRGADRRGSDDDKDFDRVIEGLAYGEYSDYAFVPPFNYRLDVTPAGDNETVVASFNADLRSLSGGVAVVFASGFLNPMANQDGAAFGLFAALPSGDVVEFPKIVEPQFARLQVIHNAADPAAEMVDVYVNGNMLLDNFAFRAATPYVDVPADVLLEIGVAPSTSTSAADIIANFPVTLAANETYVAVANGVLDPGSFEANPDGRNTAFTLFVKAMAREMGMNGSGNVDLAALHGATDAPTVDVIARGVATLVDDAAYGDFTDYFTVPAGAYTLDVTPGSDNATIVASYSADLSGLGGGAAVVFASGFLSPANDQNGAAFGLYAALPNGTVVALPTAPAPPAAKVDGLLPKEFALNQNYPNPFNPTTMIAFDLPKASEVRLSVYNVLGQEVKTLVDRAMAAGNHAIEFDADELSSGVYFYRLEAEDFRDTRKMLLVK